MGSDPSSVAVAVVVSVFLLLCGGFFLGGCASQLKDAYQMRQRIGWHGCLHPGSESTLYSGSDRDGRLISDIIKVFRASLTDEDVSMFRTFLRGLDTEDSVRLYHQSLPLSVTLGVSERENEPFPLHPDQDFWIDVDGLDVPYSALYTIPPLSYLTPSELLGENMKELDSQEEARAAEFHRRNQRLVFARHRGTSPGQDEVIAFIPRYRKYS